LLSAAAQAELPPYVLSAPEWQKCQYLIVASEATSPPSLSPEEIVNIGGSGKQPSDLEEDIRTAYTISRAFKAEDSTNGLLSVVLFGEVLKLRSLNDPHKTKFVPSRVIGTGAFGSAIQAWDRDLGEWVVLKVQNTFDDQNTYEESFEKEFLVNSLAQKAYGTNSPLPKSHYLLGFKAGKVHVMSPA
jgi:hypothetical protein